MKKIIRTNNLQKALEDYDALKGQAVSYVSVLPLPPNVRNGVYCKQSTTNIEESMVLTVDRLIENYAQGTETENHFVIPETYTITYSGDVVKGIEVSDDVAIMYEDEEFTTALATTFNLEDNYIFDVITHVTEMAYYMGDYTNQVLHPVVSFGVIAEVHAKIDRVERELDAKIDSNYNTLDNKIDNSYNTLDNKIDNSYNTLDNKIDNEISNLAVNFTTNNLVANVATVNNAFSIKDVNCRVMYTDKESWDERGWNASEDAEPDDFRQIYDLGPQGITNVIGNYQFLPSILISEKDYYMYFNDFYIYNLDGYQYVGAKKTTAPLLSLIVTGPRGNTYLMGKQFLSPNFLITSVDSIFVTGGNAGTTSSTTVSLTFTNSAVTNSFNTENTLFGATSVLGTFMVYSNYDTNMPPCGLRMNDATGITTNVMNTHFSGAGLFYNRPSMTDCFFTNPSLIVNAPSGYNVFSGITNLDSTFLNCINFNQPITIPDTVTDMARTFHNCTNFNQPVTIPNNVKVMYGIFSNCTNFNQPVTIPENVESMALAFNNCTTLASSSVPIHISHNIAIGDTSNYIYNCLVNSNTGINWTGRILNDA